MFKNKLSISFAGICFMCAVSAELPIEQIRNNAEAEALNNIQFIQSFTDILNPSFATVGGDDCDYSVLQNAINSGVDEVRITYSDTIEENVFITDTDIKLRGGFRTCSDAELNNQDEVKSIISGVENANSPVIAITGSTQRNQVQLERLEITRGSGSGFLAGGGISTLDADVRISLTDVEVYDNHSTQGGGIAIQGESDFSDVDLLMVDTLVYENTSSGQGGGGIYCSGNTSSILITKDSGINKNTAFATEDIFSSGLGGGIYLDSCDLTMYSGTSTSSEGNSPDRRGLSYNTAEVGGGGLSVRQGSQVVFNGHQICHSINAEKVCIGDNSTPLNINNNFAIYTSGALSVGSIGEDVGKISLFAGLVENNATNHPVQGQGSGGAIAVGVDAVLETGRLYKGCWNDQKCNLFKNNKSKNGGAIYGVMRAEINIFNSFFEGNRANQGTVISAESADINLTSSVLVNNGNYGEGLYEDNHVIRTITFNEFGTSKMLHNTFANNFINNSILSLSGDDNTIFSSIISEPLSRPTIGAGTATVAFDCLIASELGSLSLGPNITQNNTFEGDPVFVDPDNGNYQLDGSTSPAVDRCQEISGQEKDVIYNNRGWDDPSVTNYQSDPAFSFDAGAYEAFSNDIIFKNGFEM